MMNIKRFLAKTGLLGLLVAFTLGMALPAAGSAAVSDWQQGASIYPVNQIASPAGKASLDQLAATGANYVTFIIPYYQALATSSQVYPGVDTPSDAAIRDAVAYAHSIGLQVMLKPHLEMESGQWRAYINASDRDAWYASYGDMLVRYSALAAQTGAEQFCVGAELISMASQNNNPNNAARWEAMIERVRGVYGGDLTYSAQRPGGFSEFDSIGFWDKLDYLGLSGYFPLNVEGEPTAAKLQDSWAYWERTQVRPTVQQYNKPLLFTEVGYRSLMSSFTAPWDYERQGAASPAHQAMAYEAFIGFWNNIDYMAGVHFWHWEPTPDAGGLSDTGFTPQNKPAEDVLTNAWSGDGGTATPTPTPAPAPAPEPTPAPQPTPAPEPDPAPAPATINAWWPTDNATLYRLQPFKAELPGRDLGSYNMAWSVDGGNPNPMQDNLTDGPHKETLVDVSSWHWNPANRYTIDFIATDPSSGAEIARRSIVVTVAH